ncbi:MAG: hypothetical protein IT530_12370 [Burkholderiales bacterium]|nr:hypothetical protein [Burkholderiales bacterium]
MATKIIAGLIGVALLVAYVVPVVWRLQEVSLWCVVLLGVGMMLVDLWQSLKSRGD